MVQIFMRDLKKVSALWSVRVRVSALERFCYKGFLTNSSETKFFVRLREVPALEDVRFRKIPLYINTSLKKRVWLELFLELNTVTFEEKMFFNNISFLDHHHFLLLL